MSGSINQGLTIAAVPAPAPVVTSEAPGEVGFGQTVQIGTIDSAVGIAPPTLVFIGDAPQGTLSINAQDQILYTAPATPLPGEVDSFSYEVEDQAGAVSAPVNVSLVLDPPPVAIDPNLAVNPNSPFDLSNIVNQLATPGLSGDTLKLTAVSAAQGTILQQSNGDFVYQAFATGTSGAGAGKVTPVAGSDTISYTVTNQLGESVTGTATLTLDPGPAATDPTLIVAHGGTLDLSALVGQLATPGLSGDTLTITAALAANGSTMLTKAGDLLYRPISQAAETSWLNNAPNATDSAGPTSTFSSDSITYTVVDQLGDSTTGTASVLVDPGPTATDPDLLVGHAGTLDLSAIVDQLATPGLSGDTLTVTAVSAQNGSVFQTKLGDFVYQPIAGGNGSATSAGYDLAGSTTGATGKTQTQVQDDVVTYTLQDQAGDSVTGTADITVDPGPTIVPGHTDVAPGQTVNLASYLRHLVLPGLKSDTETITSVSAQTGQVSLGNAANGAVTVDYTAPASGTDTLTFSVADPAGDTATGTVAITADAGPILAPGSLTVAHGHLTSVQSYLASLVTPGAPGLSDTITSVTAEYGSVLAVSGSGFGGAGQPGTEFNYTPPASGSDALSFTVQDQDGLTATGTVAVTVDPGPMVSAGSVVVGHGQTVNLASTIAGLITPGLSGDTETVVAASTQAGKLTFSYGEANGLPSGNGPITYTAPASGSDALNYTVEDQVGDTASGSLAIAVDPGPMAGNLTANVSVGQTMDLTQQVLGADKPGLAGDTLTLVADGSQGSVGNVSLVNGDLVYTASNAAFAGLGAGQSATDSFSYTVADQYGDQAVGTVTLDVSNSVTTVVGGPYGGSTIEAPAGNAVIDAYDWGNTIYANGGNDTINAGQGQGTVYAGSGNVIVNLSGYNNVVSGGDGADSVSGSQGSTSVTLGNGKDSVNLAGFGNVVTVGNGSDTIAAGAGSDTVVGGSGNDTVTLAGYDNSVTLNGGNDTITGGAGSNTFDLTGGSASLALNGYGNMVFLHDTNATVTDAGQGSTITVSGGGTDIIQGAAADPGIVLDLSGGLGGYSSATAVLASLTSDGNGGALLSFGSGHGSLDFAGVAPSALHAANFQIG